MSKKLSKEPEKFGTGHPEGLVEAGAANNSALAGAWIPALVFGIPGDSITAIVIGVLYMKNMNPGPMIFMNNPQNVYAVFIVFILANLLMLPLGWACIKASARILRVPRNVLMPIILVFCLVGSFAINNALFDLWILLGFGVAAWLLEENGFPVAPAILGMLLGKMLEENFITSMIKSDGNLAALLRAADRRRAGALHASRLGRLGLDGLAAPATAHTTRRRHLTPMNDTSVRYDAAALTRFATRLLQQAGLAEPMALTVADTLVQGDLLGHDTHGLALLAGYVKELEAGTMTREGAPLVVSDRPAAVLWDGQRLPGPWLVHQGLDLLLPRAASWAPPRS